MGKRRRFLSEASAAGFYHVMSRTVADAEHGGMMFFGAHEKNRFARQLRRHSEFSGIEVLTWCMMDNHFHLLIRVPVREEYLGSLMADGREKFWRRMGAIYRREEVADLRNEVARLESLPDDAGGQAARRRAREMVDRYARRMADLPAFVRDLKRSFSVWFNRKHGRRGTVWMDRYKSVLLEGEPWVLNKVAAYIDLNPVRAGLAQEAGRYRWCGYGEAVRGHLEARRGLSRVYGLVRNEWGRIGEDYRRLLRVEGGEVGDLARASSSGESQPAGGGEAKADVRMAERTPTRMAGQVRYFSDGAAVGSREFLEMVFEQNRKQFSQQRATGARKFRGALWKDAGLYSLRDLAPG